MNTVTIMRGGDQRAARVEWLRTEAVETERAIRHLVDVLAAGRRDARCEDLDHDQEGQHR